MNWKRRCPLALGVAAAAPLAAGIHSLACAATAAAAALGGARAGTRPGASAGTAPRRRRVVRRRTGGSSSSSDVDDAFAFVLVPSRRGRKGRLDATILRSASDRGLDGQSIDDDAPSSEATSKASSKVRFRARVAYSGTPYSGWQLQPSKTTVQGEIESALGRRFLRRIPVVGAGRTDAGVHARGQACHFDLRSGGEAGGEEVPFAPPPPPGSVDEGPGGATRPSEEERRTRDAFCREFQHSLNRMLPLDVRVFNLQLAPYTWTTKGAKGEEMDDESDGDGDDDCETGELLRARPWHAIQSATSKWYSYRFVLGPTLSNPTERYTRTHFVHRPRFAQMASEPSEGSPSMRPSKSAAVSPHALTTDDIERLMTILKTYEGRHDFRAFGGQMEQTERRAGRRIDTIRTVRKVELVKEPLCPDASVGIGDPRIGGANGPEEKKFDSRGFVGEEGNYRVDFLLDGALYKMVRNMVGTAMEVWLGRMSRERLEELLRARGEGGGDEGTDGEAGDGPGRKDNPCKPAPPEGLTLQCVYYDGDEF